MFQSLKTKFIIILSTVVLSVPLAFAGTALAAPTTTGGTGQCTNIGSGIAKGVTATGNPGSCSANTGSLTSGISKIGADAVNLFSIIVGILSVIMIIYAGLRYITSGGESGGVTSAKNTLIYAIIGLIIVVLAQLIVRYVLNYSSSLF